MIVMRWVSWLGSCRLVFATVRNDTSQMTCSSSASSPYNYLLYMYFAIIEPYNESNNEECIVRIFIVQVRSVEAT